MKMSREPSTSAEREREHHGVARRNVGDWNAGSRCLGNRERRIGERRAADAGEVHAHHAMLAGTECRRDARCSEEFRAMSLTIIDAERKRLEAAGARHGKRGGGIQATGQQHDRGLLDAALSLPAHFPGTSPHNIL